jgi:hypothetical protein
MKQPPLKNPGPTPVAERVTKRKGPRPARDGARLPDERHRGGDRRTEQSEADRVKPPPARVIGPSAETAPSAPPPPIDEDVEEARIEVAGRVWSVRVLGRSGRASRGAAPLLLLGFWDAAASGEQPVLEVSVVGRTLARLTPEQLEEALGRAFPPLNPERKRSFFDMGHQPKRR